VPLEYAAVEGQQLDPVRISFGNDDTPWMREHALMIQTSFEELNAPTELESVPVNVLYDEHWPVDTGHIDPVTMNVHGPDPQRGLDPNPFLMRMHPETGGNYYNYWNDEITDLLNEETQEVGDADRRAELVREAQAKASEDAYIISVGFPDVITAANTADWTGYVPTPGNGTTQDSFIWSQVNLQPETDETTWVKGVTDTMNGTNIAWGSGGPEEKRLLNVYDGLADASPQLEIAPALATDWEAVDDTTVEMELRDGIEWHDGEPFGPEDVKFTVELYKEFNATSQGPFYNPIDSVEVLSESGGGSIRFNLAEPDAPFLTQRIVRSVILPEHRWSDVDNPSQHNPDPPIGTGPFKFVDWAPDTRLEVEKHESHWVWDDDVRREILSEEFFEPGDGIDGIVWSNVGNTDALIGSLQQGDIDAIGTTLSNEQADRAAETDGVEKQISDNFAVLDVHINHIVPLIRDKEFRRAISHSVDKEGFFEGVLGGRGTVAEAQNLISPLMEQWYNPDAPGYAFDREEARSILQRAGYTVQNGTLAWPSGEAWDAFAERVEDGHAGREELDQPDFS
jgi:peptide/nickel transport system substrate-binding protein